MPGDTDRVIPPVATWHLDEDKPCARTGQDRRDDLGVHLDDLDAVREEARLRAHLVLGEGHRQGQDRRTWMIEVVDVTGEVVLSISLGDAVSARVGRGSSRGPIR